MGSKAIQGECLQAEEKRLKAEPWGTTTFREKAKEDREKIIRE